MSDASEEDEQTKQHNRDRNENQNVLIGEVRDAVMDMNRTLDVLCTLLQVHGVGAPQRPFCCPVCLGKTAVVDTTFSGTTYSMATIPCPACNGAGVLWR